MMEPLRGTAALVGPLIDKGAFEGMQGALGKAKAEGGQVFGGERQLENQFPGGYYVRPALAMMPKRSPRPPCSPSSTVRLSRLARI